MTPAITNVELPAARLRRRCDPDAFAFATTAEVATSAGLIGQRRALDALTFGLAMAEHGFNIYVAGPPGTGKATAVRAFVEGAAKQGRSAEGELRQGWAEIFDFVVTHARSG